ncbi:MAG: UDP-N-acetylmuramoyl-L-alanine--D-glutamate ligase, partial [Pyramidobacter sp.]|nr:UDP-N-acetylmuramoyl-L-alanine--D-glutamate ligase [Pyramidobacter sp.]
MAEKITIVGAGVSGRALALFAARSGAEVFVTDSRAELPESTQNDFKSASVRWECGGHTLRCCECDLMVVSSGVPETSPAVVMARDKKIPVQGELDFLAPFLHGKLIAVTGTNGKTTCTSLIAHILKENGIDAIACGNIGEPLAAHAREDHEALVMELSSFQLHWNTRFAPDVAVLTNLAPDHIDWHGSYENYVDDKCKIFLPPKDGGFAVVHQEDAFRVPGVRRTVVLGSGADRIELADKESSLLLGGQKRVLFRTAALPLIGTHNLENASMSAAAAVLAFPQIDVEKALPSFKVPRHRCEKVCEKNGVLYVDDSKGTNVAAAV